MSLISSFIKLGTIQNKSQYIGKIILYTTKKKFFEYKSKEEITSVDFLEIKYIGFGIWQKENGDASGTYKGQ